MVAVFSIFATLGVITFKQLGVGLAVAVFLDATLVRGVALPAVVALLGERGWRVRKWKDAEVGIWHREGRSMSAGSVPHDAERRTATSPVAFSIALGAFAVIATTIICTATGGGYFWPFWVALGCVAALMPLLWWKHLGGKPNTARTRVLWHADISATAAAILLLIWLFTGAHGAWIFWAIFGLAMLLGLHALIDLRAEVPQLQTRELQERVDTLSRTRRQAVDAQAAELRRIERDLHDGAQARLVALTMQLGRAEAALAHEPEAAALVRAAREEATIAIQELRDLARGIAPPVLTDRGLIAAAQSLVDRAGASLAVTADNGGKRVPPAVENAAYFVIAEALTNVAKACPGRDCSRRPRPLSPTL